MAGAGFSNIPGIDENVVYIIKNPRNFTKVTLGIYKIKKYFKISTIYECIYRSEFDNCRL